jgi:hypothetical protein
MISLADMNRGAVDPERAAVTAQGGATWAQLNRGRQGCDGPRPASPSRPASTRTISSAGHSPHLTHPTALAAVIEASPRQATDTSRPPA